MMEVAVSSRLSVSIYHTVQHHILEDCFDIVVIAVGTSTLSLLHVLPHISRCFLTHNLQAAEFDASIILYQISIMTI
jgi:hypothetical protein